MYRLFVEADNAWQFVEEYEELPKGFQVPENCRIERENNGVYTILEDLPKSTEIYTVNDPIEVQESPSLLSKIVGFFK